MAGEFVKKKAIKYLFLIMVSLFICGCSVENGRTYQKYYWAYSPKYIYDTNPYTPSIIYNDEYFAAGEGSYYMEYTAWDGSSWYMYYSIEVDKGFLFDRGDDFYYEIDLYAAGPTLYRYRDSKDINSGKNADAKTFNSGKELVKTKVEGLERGPIVGSEERIYEKGKVRIEYGRLY